MGEDHEGFGQKEREVSFAVAAAVTVSSAGGGTT